MMTIVTVLSIGVLAYVFLGYPMILRIIVWLRGVREVRQQAITPRVSFVISAYNEAAVIEQKLQNALALDYPAGALEIVVISDSSSDGTDAIVERFAGQGVRLLRQAARAGKTAGLNRAIPQLNGEIVVFSDANAMYDPQAIRRLVRNFADPAVGCVTGEARYLTDSHGMADVSERAYWDYEIRLKRFETAVGSMVGGDGAIYAIRRELWRELPANAINDFLNPLQIVEAGWRAVYEPEAICYEETAGGLRREWRRRIRIVSRSWRAIFQAAGVLNPFRVGFFAVSVISHKVLRWLSGAFLVVAALGTARFIWIASPLTLGYIVLIVAPCAAALPYARRLFGFGVYFLIINAASVIGVVKGSFGQVSGTWNTPRTATERRQLPTAAPVALMAAIVAVVVVVAFGSTAVARKLFWTSSLVLAYVYVGYPIVLAALKRLSTHPVGKADQSPIVCLFVTANDEAAVIGAKLQNCLQLDYPREQLRIVVASDGSIDGTNAIVRSFAPQGVTLLAFPTRRGKISAINEGMRSVDCDVVVFSDANTMLKPDAIRVLVRAFADPSVGAVSGDVILVGERASIGRSEDLYYKYERWLQRSESAIGSMIGVDGALYGIRRELFEPQPDTTILDDFAIAMAVVRRGRRVTFEPDAVAYEAGSESATEEFLRKSRVVAGAVQFMMRAHTIVPFRNLQVTFALLSHKVLRWLSPVFAGVAFLAALALARQSESYLTTAIAAMLFLGVAAAGCDYRLRRLRIVGFAHYLCLVQAAALFGFVRGLLGRQSVVWRRFERATVEQT